MHFLVLGQGPAVDDANRLAGIKTGL